MLPLDLELLLQAGELPLDIGQFRPVRFQFRILADLGLQLHLRRRVGFPPRLEHGVVEAAGRDRSRQHQNPQQLEPRKFAHIRSAFTTSPFRRSA